jgi:hypothetical protein
MKILTRFAPKTFNANDLQIIEMTFDEIFFNKGEYKKMEEILFGTLKVPQRICYKDDIEIAEYEYEKALADNIHLLYRNNLHFVVSDQLCNLLFYHMEDDTYKFVVEVEFFSQGEKDRFVRPYWFGKEVDEEKYSAYAIWKEIYY